MLKIKGIENRVQVFQAKNNNLILRILYTQSVEFEVAMSISVRQHIQLIPTFNTIMGKTIWNICILISRRVKVKETRKR